MEKKNIYSYLQASYQEEADWKNIVKIELSANLHLLELIFWQNFFFFLHNYALTFEWQTRDFPCHQGVLN